MGLFQRFSPPAARLLGTLALAATGAQAAALPPGCVLAGQAEEAASPVATLAQAAFPPVQLELQTPVAPGALPADGRRYLVYEVHLRSFAHETLALRRLDVLAGDGAGAQPLASFAGAQLARLLVPVGPGASKEALEAGRSAVALLCLAFEGKARLPRALRHRMHVDSAVAEGPLVPVAAAAPMLLGAPVTGAGWTAGNGPSLDSHHRVGLIVAGGKAQISRRYALDWKKLRDGAQFTGNALDVRSYHAYGETVLAVADGTVVEARDGFPDNVPRTAAGFTPAVPLTIDSIAGNTIVIALPGGGFASYSHLQPGSVKVETGQRVRRGQPIGRIGNSGDARWPHLHFQVTSAPGILDSEGLPFVFEAYRTPGAGGAARTVRGEYPLGDIVIDIDTGTRRR